ncbi:MAG: tyrosine-type recombinase/integrase [Candidatus Melainabacteria bacterium]|nr:tyrosine-type recombinase/integrase [Candidatus Melainabacteria bacterium]
MSEALSTEAANQLLRDLHKRYRLYISSLKKQPLSPHTVRAYQVRMQHFLGFLGENIGQYKDALTNSNTRDYVTRDYKLYLKQELKSSPQTVNAYLTAIDSFYIFLGLGKVKAKREDLPNLAPQALTPKEQKDFLRATEDCKSARDQALATLLFYTGLRISECAALNIDDVPLSERKGLVIIRVGKGGGYREIPLNSQCREALQNWIAQRKKKFPDNLDPAFFISNLGQRLSIDGIDHAIRKLAKSAKLEGVSAHTLRHTCLTNLVRAGNDMVMVAQIGGHKKLETTMRYSLPTRFDQEAAMEKIQVEY